VPTLRFADDSTLTNPSIVQVKAQLAAIAAATVRRDEAGSPA
jgi:hypothetical protein